MSTDLQKVIADTQEHYKASPSDAKVSFKSRSKLTDGLVSNVSMREHQIVVDEPPQLGGTDTGPNPVELILGALGSCQEITYKAYATAMGIPLDSVSVELTGNIDLRGFFAVDDSVRAGYENITGTVTIESSASAEALQQLQQVVNAHCPVLDILTGKVPVNLALNVVGAETTSAA